MISFGAPALLAALAAAPLALALGWLLWRRRRLHLLALRELGGGAIAPSDARRGGGWAALALAAALALLAFAAARPQFGADESALERPPLGVVIALDVSQSMSAADLRPSRFDAAVAEVRRLVGAQRTVRFGLVIFAGEPFVRFPLTLDHASALAVLAALQAGESLVPPGSNIAAAIGASLDLLRRSGASGNVAGSAGGGAIVVLSDGETHEGDAAAAARSAAEAGVRVFAAGVGSALGARVPAARGGLSGLGGGAGENRIDARTGREVISRLEEGALQAIAAAGSGRYVRVDAPGALGGLAADLAAIDRARDAERRTAAPREQFQWFAGAALALLLGGSLLRAIPLQRVSGQTRRLLALTALLAFTALWLTSCADSAASRANREGNAHFAAGRYAEALESYREAQRRAPDEPALALNAGRALHELGEFERAETATLGAMRSDDPQVRALALFHAGNHRWAGGDLLGARAAFVESLRARPDLRDAKINLELVNRLLAQEAAESDVEASSVGAEAGMGESEDADAGQSEAATEGQAGGGGQDGSGRAAAPGEGAAAETQSPSFGETDRVAQREAAEAALSEALEALPLEDASAEQAMAVLDALRAIPDERFGSGPSSAPLEGVDDW